MQDTLWKYPEKKFKPRNKQAALICIKAKPFFQPPVEEPKPVMAETFAQRLARENAEREKRVAVLRAEAEAKAAIVAEQERKQREERKNRKQAADWAQKQAKKIARYGGYTRKQRRLSRS